MIDDVVPTLLCNPYDFQVESSKLLWKCRYGLSGDEMGLGKSLEAILCTVAHMTERDDAKIILCVPAFLKANWDREFNKFTIHIRVKTCFSAKDIPEKWDGYDAIVINYEQLEKTKHLFRKATMVVADECHYLKTNKSKRTMLFCDYIHSYKPDRMILLSGTPIKNRIPEYYSLIRLLDMNPRERRRCEMSYVQFCDYFCYREERRIPGKRFVEIKWVGFKNESDFFKLIDGRHVRHLAKDVLDLPEIVRQNIYTKKLPATGEDSLGDELRGMWENFLLGIQSQFLASRKMESSLLKVPYTIGFVNELLEAGNGPVIVFSDHVNPAVLIGTKWGDRGAVITGDTPIPKRDEIVSRFQKGELDVLSATIGTMSAGYTLTKSNRMVFNDLPWGTGDFDQAVKRFHRIGQEEKCFVYNIVTTELDQMIMATLEEKSSILKSALKKTH